MSPATLIALIMSLRADPLIMRVKPKSVERRPVRTATEEVGVQASRLSGSLAAVNAGGKGVNCPKAIAAKLPGTAVEDAPFEPRYADVLMENGRPAKISVVPKSMLPKIYEIMKTRDFDKKTGGTDPSIVWQNACLCQQRAQFLGAKLADKLNLETGKLVASTRRFGLNPADITATLPNQRTVNWPLHVTNFVMVDEGPGKSPSMYALDVSLFPDAPVPVETWRKALKNVGDNGWGDMIMGRPTLALTNRFAFGPHDKYSYIDSYPADDSKDYHSLSKVRVQLADNNGRGTCLGQKR